MADTPKIKELFVAALELPDPTQRRAFLDRACGADAELRQRLDVLLRAHDAPASALNHPLAEIEPATPAEAATADATAEAAGTLIAEKYKLLERIGEGGMGTVWLAEQTEPVKRQVAIKLIKPGRDSGQVIARFEAERQALALMDHPNIAKVLDAGTIGTGDEGRGASDIQSAPLTAHPSFLTPRPYFVMELVTGVPITRYCDEHHLTLKERLELFVPVCHAVQHAHQKGIIHRDLKPSNVLVCQYDDKPVPKIIDFGVAKATGPRVTEATSFTEFGQVIGTLEYMSPEQAELNPLDIDTRSDIYSLGVLLYELLTGTTPVDRARLRDAAFGEMLRVIREVEPLKPSTRLSHSQDTLASVAALRHTEPAKLTRLVRGELDWIVMKALEKVRARRYPTAIGFAHDIERYLHDEPVHACPPSVGYRFRKFARRNKGPIAAVSLVLLALLAGIIGTSMGLIRADKARRDAVAAQLAEAERAEGERRAKDGAQRALEAEKQAREAEISQRQRAEGNAALATAVLNDLIKNPEQEKQARASLEQGLKYYEQLADTNPMDWAARRERAKAYANVGLLQLNLRNYVQSEKAYGQAVHLMEDLARERPSDFDTAYELAATYHGFYRAYWDNGRTGPAEEITRHALALFEKLVADFPERRAFSQESRAYAQRNLAVLLQRIGRAQEAEKSYQQCLEIWSELAAAYPKAAGYRNALAYDNGLLGDLYYQVGQLSKADAVWREAEALWGKLAVEFPGEPGYLSELAHLDWRVAGLLKQGDKPKEAAEAYRRALRRFEKLVANFPATVFYRVEHANTYRQLATLFRETGRAEEAEKAYYAAVPIHEKLVLDFPANAECRARLASNLAELAAILAEQGKHAAAAALAEKMISARPTDASAYQTAAFILIRCMALTEKDAKASAADRKAVNEAYADRARDLLEEAARRGLDTPFEQAIREALRPPRDDAQLHYCLGNALHHYGHYSGAEAAYREALRLRPDFGEARAKLRLTRWNPKTKTEVEAECREALRQRPDDPEVHYSLGFIIGWGEYKPLAAVRFYTEAFAAHPNLADDLRFPNRYTAACAAAAASRGEGHDTARLDDTERARLRRQALDWLRADLTTWNQLLEKEPDKARPRVQKMLRYWKWDGDFAFVRGDALAKLPEPERQPWQQLWADVEQTLKKAGLQEAKDTKQKPPG